MLYEVITNFVLAEDFLDAGVVQHFYSTFSQCCLSVLGKFLVKGHAENMGNRITSYNVCYTKLLRH